MKGKRDNLYDALKKKDTKTSLLDYIDINSMFQLSLTCRKYYMLLKPIIEEIRYQQQKEQKQRQPKNKPKKGKKEKEKEKGLKQEQIQEVAVNVDKMTVEVARKKILPNIKEWIYVTKCPINNQFIQKKFQQGTMIMFQNIRTKELLYINRSIIDPTLNYDKGGFDDDLDNKYEQLYEDEEFSNDYDFSSQESMLKRQKEILIKIQQRKAKKEKQEELRYEDELEKVFKIKKIAIILCFGGSFSLAIYEGQKCIIHKSDKKYVCRKKAGERQLNKDKASGSNIKSMGSQIRRDQEKKHMFNVSQILTTHRNDLEACDLVFLQAPGLNRLVIINESQTLCDLKGRLRSICLTAKKANYTQVQVIFEAITKFSLVSVKKEQKEVHNQKM